MSEMTIEEITELSLQPVLRAEQENGNTEGLSEVLAKLAK